MRIVVTEPCSPGGAEILEPMAQNWLAGDASRVEPLREPTVPPTVPPRLAARRRSRPRGQSWTPCRYPAGVIVAVGDGLGGVRVHPGDHGLERGDIALTRAAPVNTSPGAARMPDPVSSPARSPRSGSGWPDRICCSCQSRRAIRGLAARPLREGRMPMLLLLARPPADAGEHAVGVARSGPVLAEAAAVEPGSAPGMARMVRQMARSGKSRMTPLRCLPDRSRQRCRSSCTVTRPRWRRLGWCACHFEAGGD